MSAIAMLMTVGVYGLVAGIVKLDDLGKYLMKTGAADSEALLRQRTGPDGGHRVMNDV